MHIRLFGIKLTAGTLQETVQTITGWVKNGERHHQVIVANVHLLTEAQENAPLKDAFENAALAVTDGMPLVWLARKEYPQAERIVGVELMQQLCQQDVSIFLLGGADGVAAALAKKLQMLYPKLKIVGTACPPFRRWSEEEEDLLIARINIAQPDILFVAFGAPKQELWIARNKNTLNVPAIIGVGAAFDYALGRLKRAPRWMQACGMEWFFRLLQEPRRLLKRYVISNTKFIVLVLRQYLNPLR